MRRKKGTLGPRTGERYQILMIPAFILRAYLNNYFFFSQQSALTTIVFIKYLVNNFVSSLDYNCPSVLSVLVYVQVLGYLITLYNSLSG